MDQFLCQKKTNQKPNTPTYLYIKHKPGQVFPNFLLKKGKKKYFPVICLAVDKLRVVVSLSAYSCFHAYIRWQQRLARFSDF